MVAAPASSSPTTAPSYMTSDAVGQREDLVQILADEKHRHTLRGGLPQVGVDGLDRATSRPRVGWAAISTRGSPWNSRPSTSFWRLPPERLRAGVSGPGALTS